MERWDVVIIGAGVVGCAVAQRLAGSGLTVLLIESARKEGTGLTSRNSGVVHSGLYYLPGSLKARLCLEGQARLYAWCDAHRVPFQRCGKLVVASGGAQRGALEALVDNARASGAEGLRLLSRAEAVELEPILAAGPVELALWSPNSGIVDAHGLTHSLRVAAEAAGVDVAFHGRVNSIERHDGRWEIGTERGSIEAVRFVNAAGLQSDALARAAGLTSYRHRLSRGDYYRWQGAPVFQRLIYPVRVPGDPGLGVHVTRELDGGVRLGPDAKWVDRVERSAPPVSLALTFSERIEALIGPLPSGELTWDGYGVRPKLVQEDGTPVDDFMVVRHQETSWHLLGIESPGLTAALALGRLVGEEVLDTHP